MSVKNDIPFLMNELDRIAHDSIPQTCPRCPYARQCWRGDGNTDCMILKEIEYRLDEWYELKSLQESELQVMGEK